MLSVVIPLYNKERSIQKTIRSVLDQSVENLEIIVVDDGSTDASIERVQEFTDARIKIIRKENGGVSETRNAGIKAAKYDYIALLDADDIWEPEYLEEQVKLIREYPDASLWSCAYGHIYKGEKIHVDHYPPSGFRDYIENYFSIRRKTDLFCASSVVIRKVAFADIGGFDTRIKYAEDLDVWYRIINCFPVVFYNKTLAYYQQDAENRALDKHIKLVDYLPYYIDKYNEDAKYSNDTFLSYINNWAAAKIQQYYFHNSAERQDAREAIKKLDFDKIHPKYRLMYKSPYIIGFFAYQVVNLKKWIWKKLPL